MAAFLAFEFFSSPFCWEPSGNKFGSGGGGREARPEDGGPSEEGPEDAPPDEGSIIGGEAAAGLGKGGLVCNAPGGPVWGPLDGSVWGNTGEGPVIGGEAAAGLGNSGLFGLGIEGPVWRPRVEGPVWVDGPGWLVIGACCDDRPAGGLDGRVDEPVVVVTVVLPLG